MGVAEGLLLATQRKDESSGQTSVFTTTITLCYYSESGNFGQARALAAPLTGNRARPSLMSSKSSIICCLMEDGEACTRAAGDASFNKKIQDMASLLGMRLAAKPKFRYRYICDHHKSSIQAKRRLRERSLAAPDTVQVCITGSVTQPETVQVCTVDLTQLGIALSSLSEIPEEQEVDMTNDQIEVTNSQDSGKAHLDYCFTRHLQTIHESQQEDERTNE